VKCPSGIFVLNLVPSDTLWRGWLLWEIGGPVKKDSTAAKYKTFD